MFFHRTIRIIVKYLVHILFCEEDLFFVGGDKVLAVDKRVARRSQKREVRGEKREEKGIQFNPYDFKQFLELRNYYIDDALINILDAIINRERKPDDPITSFLLVGVPGSGKTSLAKLVADFLGAEYIMQQITPGVTEEDLYYKYIPDETTRSGFRKVEGALIQALRKSREKPVVLVIDEIDKANPRVDSFFLTYLQEGALRVGFGGEEDVIVGDKDNMIVFFTSNMKRDVEDPLLRRVNVIEMQPMSPYLVYKLLKKDGIKDDIARITAEIYNAMLYLALDRRIEKFPSYNEARQFAKTLEIMYDKHGGIIPKEVITELIQAQLVKKPEDMKTLMDFINSQEYDNIKGKWAVSIEGKPEEVGIERVVGAVKDVKLEKPVEKPREELIDLNIARILERKQIKIETKGVLPPEKMKEYMKQGYTVIQTYGDIELTLGAVLPLLLDKMRDSVELYNNAVVIKKPFENELANLVFHRSTLVNSKKPITLEAKLDKPELARLDADKIVRLIDLMTNAGYKVGISPANQDIIAFKKTVSDASGETTILYVLDLKEKSAGILIATTSNEPNMIVQHIGRIEDILDDVLETNKKLFFEKNINEINKYPMRLASYSIAYLLDMAGLLEQVDSDTFIRIVDSLTNRLPTHVNSVFERTVTREEPGQQPIYDFIYSVLGEIDTDSIAKVFVETAKENGVTLDTENVKENLDYLKKLVQITEREGGMPRSKERLAVVKDLVKVNEAIKQAIIETTTDYAFLIAEWMKENNVDNYIVDLPDDTVGKILRTIQTTATGVPSGFLMVVFSRKALEDYLKDKVYVEE